MCHRRLARGFGATVVTVCLQGVLIGCAPEFVAPPGGTVALAPVASGLTAPVALAAPPDDSGRLFIVDQVGMIRVVDPAGSLRATPFLDLRGAITPLNPTYDERGLLGLAFHPDYATNGRFFVVYNAPPGPETPEGYDHEWRLAEFRVSAADANVADPGSEGILLRVPHPQFNHNGGQLAFGADGLLYISTGDGGGANDTGLGHNPQIGNGQDLGTLLGKLLRINVDAAGEAYSIPPDNPFVNVAGALPEIWAYGLRNPWRFSFDRATGRLFLGDAGQDLFEEIDIIERGGNYGWRIREGFACFDPEQPGTPPQDCAQVGPSGQPLLDPILEFAHVDSQGRPLTIVVIGGYVYRGGALPALEGDYIFGHYSTIGSQADGRLLAARAGADGAWTTRQLRLSGDGLDGRFILAFGEDAAGELYVLTSRRFGPVGETGQVFRIVPPN